MPSLKKTILNTPIFTIGEFLQRGGSFLLLPLLTYYISPDEFGKAIICVTIASFFSGFVSLNIVNAVIRFSTDKINNEDYLYKLYSTITIFLLFSTLVVNILIGTLFLILNSLFFEIEIFLPLLIIFLSSVITPYDTYQRMLISREKPKSYLRNQILNFMIYSFSLFGLIFFKFEHLAIIFATIISYSFFYILLIIELRISYKKSLDFDFILLKEVLTYSVRLIPNRFFSLLPNILDRLIISQISISSIALYSLGYRLGEASLHLSIGFLKIYPRWLYLALDDYKTNLSKIQDLYKHVVIISTLIATSLTMISEDIVRIMLDERYFDCWVLIPLISFMVLFNNIRSFWLDFILYDKKKAYLATFPTISFCIVSIFLMLVLYQHLDIFGIGLSMLISSIISLIVTLVCVKKLKYKIFNVNYIYICILVMFSSAILYFYKLPVTFKLLSLCLFSIITIISIKKLFNLDHKYDKKPI